MRHLLILFFLLLISAGSFSQMSRITPITYLGKLDSFSGHQLILDSENKILPWHQPASSAYDYFLRKRWNFIENNVPPAPGSTYPQYYFYCAYWNRNTLEPDTWMNDVGEKLPNWFESARLFYAYTGNVSALDIVKKFIDYEMGHGISPATFSWPGFPFATANAGDTLYQGFTSGGKFNLYETQVDHSGDIGMTYLNMYLFFGEKKYLDAAVRIANVLSSKIKPGSRENSPWPYLVNASTGEGRWTYGANWMGAYTLLDKLSRLKTGNYTGYRKACLLVKEFLLNYPMKTGLWTDAHTDGSLKDRHAYRSNMSASNFKLYLFDHPEFDEHWKDHIPELISWTETYFINRSAAGETGTLWGANIVGEQDGFMYKMDYQTARYAAECARWYAVSGDERFKEKAFRSLNLVTYCSDSNGKANESPLSHGISNWWSDCYGECPRMFYHVFAGVPEWTPPGENHILYAATILNQVDYQAKQITYTATEDTGLEYLHLNFKPSRITLNNRQLHAKTGNETSGYSIRQLANGDYAVNIYRNRKGSVVVR